MRQPRQVCLALFLTAFPSLAHDDTLLGASQQILKNGIVHTIGLDVPMQQLLRIVFVSRCVALKSRLARKPF